MPFKVIKLFFLIPFIVIRKIKWVYYSFRFGNFGKGSSIDGKVWLTNPANIYIGKSCQIGPYCRIETFPNYMNKRTEPKLIIGDNCSIQHAVHIYCTTNIELRKGCLIASGCMITDENHGTDPEGDHYLNQPLISKPTILKEDVWLGENVCILSGSTIGKRSIIGANSVVTGNIPDYCSAAGNPAKVIKNYNFETKVWEKA